MGLAACGEEAAEEQACQSNKEYFKKKVWVGVLQNKCYSCHSASGVAKHTKLVLQPSAQTGYNIANLKSFTEAAAYEVEGKSILLQKPLGKLDHQGGAILKADSEDFKIIQSMLERIKKPVECADTLTVESHFTPKDTVQMDGKEALRRTTLNLGGRLPTAEEYKLIEEQGDAGFDSVIENLSKEDVFYERIEEMFNDMFLTNRYVGSNRAVDLLDRDIFPDARWYNDDERDNSSLDPEFVEKAKRHTNNSVAREPLKLISYVVKNNKPFTEILTANYILVNPYSAFVYGIKDLKFDNPLDENEWKEGTIPGQSHAGVLTSPMFLNRFPTTATNRNRHRARMVYSFFLATDVMALAERPLDPTSIEDFNPTLYNPSCVSCHTSIDPVAGAFQNWNGQGTFSPPENGWFEDMRPPGFEAFTIPFDQRMNSLPWLGAQFAADRRFATATVYNLYKGITGHEVLNPLTNDQKLFDEEIKGQEVQQKFFEATAQKFIDSNYNLKVVIAEIVKSPYFRMKNLAEGASEGRRAQHSGIGTGRLLTPEMLHRKVEAVTGFAWSNRYNSDQNLLLRENDYRILYGGIDSDDVTQRITAPNGIMANIQWRMANEMSCKVTGHDFAKDAGDRLLFPHIERKFEPEDENGFVVQEAVNAIRKNIQHMHWHFLGEQLAMDDPEIDRTYNLWYDTWKEGKAAVKAEEQSRDVHYACRAEKDPYTDMDYPEDRRVRNDSTYTVRAWQAVVAYMLADYKFLYE